MRKLIKILSIITVFCLLTSTFVACANNGNGNHTCEYGVWTSNGDGTHTRTCKTNTEHKQTEDCSGGVATETNKAVCGDCNAEYGELLGHIHVYDKEVVEDKYLDTTATCEDKAKYYYSCECGVAGDLSFESGDFSFHIYENEKCIWCEMEIVASEGLSYKLINDDTEYEVSIGSCEDKQIVIPSTHGNLPVTQISYLGFAFNKKIESVILCNGIKNIEERAFGGCSELKNVVLPDSLLKIGTSAFSSCKKLSDIVIPDGVVEIGESAFFQCSSLTSVVIPGSVEVIGESAFLSCSNLKDIELVDGIVAIKGTAFGSCSLESINIPDSVTSIGGAAFSGCSSLKEITIGKNLTTLNEDVFLRCYALANIKVSSENPSYKAIDGNLYSKDGKTLVQYAIGKTETEFTIPSGVTSIFAGAFGNSKMLTRVIFTEDVESIGGHALYGCKNLRSIEIPKNVKDIGFGAFVECPLLETITVDSANAFYKAENNVLYTKDGKKLIQYAACKEESIFIIPNGVEIIDQEAFYSAKNLVSIVIPNSVKSIGSGAFLSCSSIENITFQGDIEEWKSITKEVYWSGSVRATEIVCDDGKASLT